VVIFLFVLELKKKMLARDLIRKRAIKRFRPKVSGYAKDMTTSIIAKRGLRPIRRSNTVIQERNRGEVKGVDTPINGINLGFPNMDSNASGVCLNLIQTGSGYWNREGRKIQLKSLRIKATLDYVASPVSISIGAQNIRVAVIYDKSPNGGTLPKFNEIFAHTDQTGTAATVWNSPQSFKSMQRFTILRDKVYDFDPASYVGTTGGEVEMTQTIDEYIRLDGYDTVYASTANPATIADVYSGGIYLYAMASWDTDITRTLFDPSSFARLRYLD